jgi:hypothetical protein
MMMPLSKRRAAVAAVFLLCGIGILVWGHKQWRRARADDGPQPRVVDPGDATRPPSDAVVLFDGKDLSQWVTADGQPARCQLIDGEMHCRTGAGDAYSKATFGAAQIHLEYNVPHMPDQTGQMRGNSGIFVQACYEVQILDSFQNPTYADGSNSAVYGFAAPLVNAGRPPGQWQTYDMIFRPPRCDNDGNIAEPGMITVFLNGVLVHDRVQLAKPGPGCTLRSVCDAGPLRLQDHSGFPGAPDTTLRFRNIWYRPLD